MDDKTCLGMFAKFWSPGKVKTRLAKTIGAKQAAYTYRAFLKAQAQRLHTFGDSVLVYSPHERLGDFREFLAHANLSDDWELMPQAEGDLGERMRHFFQTAFQIGYEKVLVVGSDTPTLPLAFLDQALKLLDQHEVVLGPTTDGGYYLVGANRKTPPIFTEISWSSELVWQQTIERLQSLGTSFGCLDEWYDVDDHDDLRRLMQSLADSTIEQDQPTRGLSVALQEILPQDI